MGVMEQDWVEQLVNAPISADQPTGSDIQYEDIYVELDEELRKGEGIDIQPIDWLRVRLLAEKILKEHSKDLRVASRLSVALYFNDQFAGLGNGFSLLAGMLEADYWDEIFPTRRKKTNKLRAAAFEWLIKKLERPFSELQVKPEQVDDVLYTADQFIRLDIAVAERLGDDAPFLSEFKSQINRFRQEAEFIKDEELKKAEKQTDEKVKDQAQTSSVKSTPTEERPVNAEAKKTDEPAKPAPVAAITAQPQSVTSKADIEKALTTNNRTVDKICQLLRAGKITDAYPYHLLRSSTWMIIEQLPATGVLPKIPSENRILELQAIEQSGSWEALIEECEKSFSGGAIFWLGLHRMVARGLQELGAEQAAAAVKHNIAHLLARFPDFVSHKFANGEPFVDPITLSWIETELQQPGSDQSTVSSGESSPWQTAYKEAQQLALKGQIEDGLKLLQLGANTASGERERCYWQLQQSRFCSDAGHTDVAISQLKSLVVKIEQRGLDQWEPGLYLEVIKLLLRGHTQKQTKQKYTKEQLDEVDQLKMALCLRDPLSALSL